MKSFGDALHQFTRYRILREQTIEHLDELNKRSIGVRELARSIGLDRGPDADLIKMALLQVDETVTETESCLEQLEALNRHVAELVFVLVVRSLRVLFCVAFITPMVVPVCSHW